MQSGTAFNKDLLAVRKHLDLAAGVDYAEALF